MYAESVCGLPIRHHYLVHLGIPRKTLLFTENTICMTSKPFTKQITSAAQVHCTQFCSLHTRTVVQSCTSSYAPTSERMPNYAPNFQPPNYANNYAGIIRRCLTHTLYLSLFIDMYLHVSIFSTIIELVDFPGIALHACLLLNLFSFYPRLLTTLS